MGCCNSEFHALCDRQTTGVASGNSTYATSKETMHETPHQAPVSNYHQSTVSN